LRSYTVDEQDVIDGFGIDEMAIGGRGQVWRHGAIGSRMAGTTPAAMNVRRH
jgi:hypothetical protein